MVSHLRMKCRSCRCWSAYLCWRCRTACRQSLALAMAFSMLPIKPTAAGSCCAFEPVSDWQSWVPAIVEVKWHVLNACLISIVDCQLSCSEKLIPVLLWVDVMPWHVFQHRVLYSCAQSAHQTGMVCSKFAVHSAHKFTQRSNNLVAAYQTSVN